VVTLDSGCAARVPLAGQAKVVCAFAADMAIANVFIENFGSSEFLKALVPTACEIVFSNAGHGSLARRGG
jgi:hypothetical protein